MEDKFFADFNQAVKRYSVIHTQRTSTNTIAGFIFTASFLLWVAVVVYGLVVPLPMPLDNPAFDFHQLDTTRTLLIHGFILLSGVFTLIAFTLLRWIPQVTKVTLAVFWIPIPLSLLLAYKLMSVFSICQVIGSILTCIFIINLLKTEWFHVPEKVLKESCKMILAIPSTLVFTLFYSVLLTLLAVIIILVTVRLISTEVTYIELISIFINIIFGFWILCTLSILNLMTLNGTFAEYYWAERKSSIAFGTVLRVFWISLRYHTGTAAMHFPFLGGIKILVYLLKTIMSLFSSGASKTVKLFFFYNLFDMVAFKILFWGGAAMCIIKGKDFDKSMRDTMALFKKNPRRALVVLKVMEVVLALTTGLVIILTILSTFAYLISTVSHSPFTILFDVNSWEIKFWLLVFLGGLELISTLIQCICAASSTIVLIFQEVEDGALLGDTLPCETNTMSQNVHSTLKHDDPPNYPADLRNYC